MPGETHHGIHLPEFVGAALERRGFVSRVEEDAKTESSGSTGDGAQSASIFPSREQPSLPSSAPTSISTASSTVASNTSDGDDIAEEVKENSAKYLSKILKSAPANFQAFLDRRAELIELLKDDLTGDRLEQKAIAAALKSTKLKATDVQGAMAVIRGSLKSLQADFATRLQNERATDIESPNRDIVSIRAQITAIESQIKTLTEQKDALAGSIEPSERKIATAEQRILQAETIFQHSCESVESTLTGMEQRILTSF